MEGRKLVDMKKTKNNSKTTNKYPLSYKPSRYIGTLEYSWSIK